MGEKEGKNHIHLDKVQDIGSFSLTNVEKGNYFGDKCLPSLGWCRVSLPISPGLGG